MKKEELKAKAYDLLLKRAEIETELQQVNQAIANFKEDEKKS
jgi:hypothetical protein